MNKDELYKVVNTATTVKVFPDFIPKNEAYPAVSYAHNNNQRTRIQNGKTSGKSDYWRLSIAGNTRDECDTIVGEINLLDGTSSDMFQAVQILSINDEPADNNSTVFVAFVDIKTFDK